MLELKIHFPKENSGHVLEFHKDRQDWGYAFDSDQNWQEICLTLDAFVENAPESGLILRIAAGSFEATTCGEILCYSELYTVLKNGINHFVFNTAEMNIEKPMHLERVRQVYFGGWGESGTVHFSITAPGLESTICTWSHMQNGKLTGYLDEGCLNMSVFHTLKSFNRDIMRSIHRTRDKELFITFEKCDKEIFCNGLELGAGDCYQSHRIAAYTKKYLCTDINPLGFSENEDNITYDVLDAERVAEKFPPETFDFVYSSSLLEHLPNPEKTVNGVYQVLQEGGVFICLLPTPFWRILNTIFYPYSEHLYYLQKQQLKKSFICWKKEDDYNNNIKGEPRKKENHFGRTHMEFLLQGERN